VINHEPAAAIAEVEIGFATIRQTGATEALVLCTDGEEWPKHIEYLSNADRCYLSVHEELSEEIEAHARPMEREVRSLVNAGLDASAASRPSASPYTARGMC
jgi:hypothetical protein